MKFETNQLTHIADVKTLNLIQRLINISKVGIYTSEKSTDVINIIFDVSENYHKMILINERLDPDVNADNLIENKLTQIHVDIRYVDYVEHRKIGFLVKMEENNYGGFLMQLRFGDEIAFGFSKLLKLGGKTLIQDNIWMTPESILRLLTDALKKKYY